MPVTFKDVSGRQTIVRKIKCVKKTSKKLIFEKKNHIIVIDNTKQAETAK